MNLPLDLVLQMLTGMAAAKGRALRAKDANNTGKDDLYGQALIVLSKLGEAYVDDDLSMNEAIAQNLEDLAAMLRNPQNKAG